MNIRRIAFKVVTDTELAATRRAANIDPQAGGGQRHFQFAEGNESVVEFLTSVFSETTGEVNTRGLPYRRASLAFVDSVGARHDEEVILSPPTNTRREYRVSNVDKIRGLSAPPIPSTGDRVVLLLIERTDGDTWAHYVLESSLGPTSHWHPKFRGILADALARAPQGVIEGGTAHASSSCSGVVRLLSRSKNVLISGAPGVGKSRMLSEVARCFEIELFFHRPFAQIPVPMNGVFRTVFHQNSKYRDFVSGIAPAVNRAVGAPGFVVVQGTLFRASENAKKISGAALLIIDEINRGPAVQVFGGAIVAIESDKRLAPDGSKRAETQFFEMLDPATGDVAEYALPHDLYILAAMNPSDASVEPLDVAFLRRWEPLRLEPDESALRTFYGLGAKSANSLPDVPVNVANALEASVRAWVTINGQIALGRGPEFQIGHGVLMSDVKPQTLPLPEALGTLCVGWAKARAHVEEVFFGDTRGIAAVLNALDGPAFNPFKLTETTFADDLRFRLEGPANFKAVNIYAALRAFARE